MILSCNNISKSFGINTILKDTSFNIDERERVAVVGINGAGKTTLLKIILGEVAPDSGNVVIAKNKTIGYLSQHQSFDMDNTIFNAVLETKQEVIDLENEIRSMERRMGELTGSELESLMKDYTDKNHRFEHLGGYAYRSEVTGIIKGMGFTEEDFDKNILKLSGGQKTRVSLCRLLVSNPDIIILDEPTNHLDVRSVEWLEGFLSSYKGTVIIVSHDRYFIDKIATKIIDIDGGMTRVYQGNYTRYAAKKEALREAAIKQYLNQQQDIKHQEEVISKLKSFNREKSVKRAESREKMLEKMTRIEAPSSVNNDMHLTLEPVTESGKDVLSVTEISKAFNGKDLFSDLSFEIKRGEHVALIGDNGTGKTTILKLIMDRLDPDGGSIRLGTNVYPGYYDQEQESLDPDNTLFEEIADAYPDLTQTRIRNTLALFLFTGDDVFKKVSDLSGGEKGRLSLAKLMLSETNFLLLDEPTNHLDIESKEILESVLKSYTGTLLMVSHDRYFINETATRIIELDKGMITNYLGNYDYYLEKRAENQRSVDENYDNDTPKCRVSDTKVDWLKKKSLDAESRKQKKQIESIEKEIADLEAKKEELTNIMNDPEISSNSARLNELAGEIGEIDLKLSEMMDKWVLLSV
ncbi:MAG: ABC-F family ATP-binding cassette domain-containing protein [Lachnospiraceae bacterium]|nr:ABC-F family ATP-binding cassette domain-containing protein [Lachnospiraceae bacterium]